MKKKKDAFIILRVTQDQKKYLKQEAKNQRKTLSAFILTKTIKNEI